MKMISRFFRNVGDALGLLILLGGLMIGTNHARGVRREVSVRRKRAGSAQPVRTLNARSAGVSA